MRTTAAAVVIVGLALLVAALALVTILRETLTAELRAATLLRAAEVAAGLEAGVRLSTVTVGDPEDLLIQVLDENRGVVDSTATIAGQPALATLEAGEWDSVPVPGDDDEFLAVAVAAETLQGRRTVLVARTLDPVNESSELVTSLVAVGVPFLTAVVAATTWSIVGRALAPVEAIRREVDGISAAALDRRVPVAAGRDDEITRLASTMNHMLDRLQQARDRQRQFVSDTSHELRSPIASIRQHAEVAIAHPQRTTLADLGRTILAEDLRLQHLVDDLLMLARADEGTLALQRRPVDLDDLVFEEASRLRSSTDRRVDTASVSAGRLDGDAGALRRVLANLGDNAVRHARSQIAFSLAESDARVVLSVEDDGPGIPVAARERVFQRFVRLDEARARDSGGSGLGLAIVAEIIARHGGSVAITESRLGGARVEVLFPPSAP